MLSVGETLRRARLEQGLDLLAVAAQTKISARYLEAIESDDRKMLPSGFFYKSFVDQYARALSVDTKEIDAEVDRVLSADAPLPLPGFARVVARNVPPMAFANRFHTRRSYTSAASLVLVVIGCSGVYAWWHDTRSFGFNAANLSKITDHVVAFAKRKTVAANLRVLKPAPKPVVPSAEAPSATVPPSVPQPSAPPQRLAQPAAVPITLASNVKPSEGDESTLGSPTVASDYKVMLNLMAHEATWLSVSSDGKPVFSGILQPNESKSVGGKQFAKLRVGNAAGLEVRLNGRLLAPLGARGQVLIVLFTPDNFQIFSPPKESD